MKKLMVILSMVVAAFGAFADAQVYEMTITLKSTVAKKGKITPVVCDIPSTDEVGDIYRKQATVKIKGLFWGCDCETIAEPEKISDPSATYGYVFWNETSHKVIDGDFAWALLNRIDSKCKKTEGAWTLADDDGLNLVGAGFGTVKDTVDKGACAILSTIVTPMSGNCAGWLAVPETVVSKGKQEICEKCSVIEGSDDVVAIAPGWSLCACEDGSEFTAASGTWKLKYNASAAKKWAKVDAATSITKVYNFPAYVKSYIENL